MRVFQFSGCPVTVEPDNWITGKPSFQEWGLDALDALHLAAAKAAECDYFLTCDDRLLKRAQDMTRMKVYNPVNFVMQMAAEVTL